MQLTAIHHVAIIVSDYAKARKFYVEQLGFHVVREIKREVQKDWILNLQCGDIELEVFGKRNAPQRLSYPEACGLRHLAFRVDSVEAAVAELAAKGIPCEPIRADSITGKPVTFFHDPDGLPLELHE